MAPSQPPPLTGGVWKRPTLTAILREDKNVPTVAPKTSSKADAKKSAKSARPVIYPEIHTEICRGETAITADQAKELLGWRESEEKEGCILRDEYGKNIRCLNSTHNRAFDEKWSRSICQDILNGNYRLNGETVVIGETGEVLSANHRLVGLVLANQVWELAEGDARKHYRSLWPTPPTIESVVVTGISEAPDVVRTLDNTKPRGPADVLFTDPAYFPKAKMADRKILTKRLDYATKLLWDRTGAKDDPYSPYRTNSEVMDFLGRHKRLPLCLKHIWEEDQKVVVGKTDDGKPLEVSAIGRFLPAGSAAGLMYLMGASLSDGAAYHAAEEPGEKKINFSAPTGKKRSGAGGVKEPVPVWDLASEFWTALALPGSSVGSKVMDAVRNARRPGSEGEFEGYIFSQSEGSGTVEERTGTLIKAWLAFVEGRDPTPEDLTLTYKTTEEGYRVLAEFPVLGGIDVGRKKVKVKADPTPELDPTPEELAAKAAEEKAAKIEAKRLANPEKAPKEPTVPPAPKLKTNGKPTQKDLGSDNPDYFKEAE